MNEDNQVEFVDRFMDDIILREKRAEKHDEKPDTNPMRQYINRRRENPYQLMKVRIGG